jgi:hypothetical protein
VVAYSGIVNSLATGNADIFGHVHAGPSGSTSIGSSGYVGSHADRISLGSGVDPGWWLSDANFTFPTTTFPNTAGYLTPTGGLVTVFFVNVNSYSSNSVALPSPIPAGLTTNTTSMTTTTYPTAGTYVPPVTTNYNSGSGTIKNYTYNLISGYSWSVSLTTTNYSTNTYNQILWGSATGTNNYVANSLSGQTLVLGPNVALALPNGLSMSGSDTITLSTGNNIVGASFAQATIMVFSGGTSCTVGGNGFVNQSGYAGNLLLFCAPTVTSLALNGNGTFIGVLVAPSVNVSLNGGGSTATDFAGYLMANSVTLNGYFNFHFDESLRTAMLCLPEIITQPQNLSLTEGQDATFSVSAQGASAYQWRFNGTNIYGATNTTLTLSSVHPKDAGSYSVVVTNSLGAMTSTLATLTVLPSVSPEISSPSLNLDTFTLSFTTQAGLVYAVEYKLSLNDPSWRELTMVAGTGEPITITDNGLTNAMRFYRIHVQ